MNRSSKAIWNGSMKEGKGMISTQSQILIRTPYSFLSRFDNQYGTNPEELMAAAQAVSFTMKLSADLTSAGFMPVEIVTESVISLINGIITRSVLTLEAKVPRITEMRFLQIAEHAKATCPVSMAYNIEITLIAYLH